MSRSRPLSVPPVFLALCLLLPAPRSASAQAALTLDEALRVALEANRDFRIARIEERAARNEATWGKAGLLPRVDATAAWNRRIEDTRQVQERTPGAGTTVQETDAAESGTTSAGVGATWTVFEGFSSLAALSRLETQARLASLRREEARQDLATGVILAYGTVVREKRLLAALDSAMAFSRERVRLTQGKYGFGSASKLELLQARLDLNADSSARLRQETALAAARRGLNRLLARPESAPLEVADSLALSEVPARDALRARALERSPAYLQAAEGSRLAVLARREYLGRLAPKVDLTAGYNWGRTEAESGILREGENSGWTYGANLRFNLFDGGAVRTDLRNARLALESASLREQEARARVETGIADAWTAWRASLDMVSLETANLELARENAAIALERLRLGTIVSLELRAAQEDFLEAETRLVAARYESKRAETELLRLAGLLVPSGSAP